MHRNPSMQRVDQVYRARDARLGREVAVNHPIPPTIVLSAAAESQD